MSSKTQSWGKLYDYIARDKNNKLYSWGMSSNPYDKDNILDEYEANYKYIQHNKKAKNTYYHEILSLPSNNMTIKEQEKALYDLSDKYISMRAYGNLVIGSLHSDTGHLHMHLMISSNKYMDNKMTRHSKKAFKAIQRDVESYKNKLYPQLKTEHYQKLHKARYKQKRVEQEINHKRKKLTKKQKVLNDIKLVLNISTTKQELFYKLKEKNYTLYRRGKHYGVRDILGKKNYRLNTLEKDFSIKFIEKVKQMEQMQKIKQQAISKAKQQTLDKTKIQQRVSHERSI
jgi:hypothetical protein